jgi:hypothetical protein
MISNYRLPKERVSALAPEELQLYLNSRGWKPDVASATSNAIAYRLPQEPEAEVLLPRRRDLADYAARVADLVQAVATVERRSIWEVLHDLSGPAADVLRLAVVGPDVASGTLPLEEGLRLLHGGRDLLLAAACSEHRPQAFHPRQSYADALGFMQSCRLGQTERGSYVATIMAPVPPALEEQTVLPGMEEAELVAEPYARRVTVRLMSGLQVLVNSIAEGRPEQILNGVEAGVSANLCEALASLRPAGDQTSVQVRMSWARTRPRVPRSLPPQISFSQAAFSIAEEAGRRLRERGAPQRVTVEGYVISLKAETTLLDDFEGHVFLRAEIGGIPARVQLVLDRPSYQLACDAHRDAQRVSVTGLLRREGKTYELLQAQEFQLSPL